MERLDLWALLPTAFNDHYHERATKAPMVCIACGRSVSKNGEALGVILAGGGGDIIHPDDNAAEINDGGYMGWFPVGRECIKAVPVAYRVANPYPNKVLMV